jgi:hypothetical protein
LIDVERSVRTGDLRPPLLTRILGQTNTTASRDAAQRADHWRCRRTYETPGNPDVGELAAVIELDLAGDFEDAFANSDACGERYERICRRHDGRRHAVSLRERQSF